MYKNIIHINLHILYIIYLKTISKSAKIMKIQEVNQEIHTKQLLLFHLNCFLLATDLNLKRLNKRDRFSHVPT